MSVKIIFEAKMESLQKMMDWVREQINVSGLPTHESRKVELALEESLVNVIHHAYKEHDGHVELNCDLQPNQKIVFIIKDKGPPFNPLLQAPKIDPFDSLEEKKEGGLGIALIRHYMDDVRYEREGLFNILTLIKKI